MSKKTEKKQQQKTKLKTALFTFSSVLLIGTLFCTHIDLKKKPTTEYILFLSRSVDLFSSYFFFGQPHEIVRVVDCDRHEKMKK